MTATLLRPSRRTRPRTASARSKPRASNTCPKRLATPGRATSAAVFLGANLTWTNVVFGAFAILFGLSFWQTVSSMAVGTAVGTLAVLPTAIIGPRTGTNMTVSSGAFFGIRGRFIGSGLALAIALAFAAVTVWTSGDALVAAGHRLLGTLGERHRARRRLRGGGRADGDRRALRPRHHRHHAEGRRARRRRADDPRGVRVRRRLRPQRVERRIRAWRGFWQTWALSAVLFAAAPISYGPTIGDYTRRISSIRFSDKQICTALGIRHVHRGAAAESVRRVHRADVRQPDRLLHRRPRRQLPRLVRPARSW